MTTERDQDGIVVGPCEGCPLCKGLKSAFGPWHMYWELRDLGIFLSFYQHSFSCLCSFKESPWPLCLSYTHCFIDYFHFLLQLFSRLFFLSLYSPISSWILHPLIQKTESLGCALVAHMELQGTLTFVSLVHCWQHGNKKTYYPLSY